MKIIIFLITITMFFSCKSSSPDLAVAKSVVLEKYLGSWFEMASIPYGPQNGCSCTKATYTLKPSGELEVFNECKKGNKKTSIKGKIIVPNKNEPAKLKVQFFWPFRADYYILEVADDYSYALVGHPNRNYLWILSRTPQMDPQVYQNLVQKAKSLGFDTQRLLKTDQNNCN